MEKFSVKKPFTVLVAVIMVIMLGLVSVQNMQTNLLPNVNTPYLMVVTVYPGASPERVENEVSDVMESALGTISGVKNVTATSAENYSLLLMEFEDDTDMNSAVVKVSNKVDQTTSSLPSTCMTPSIIEYTLNMNAFMTVAVSREGSDSYELADFVNDTMVPYIERQGGVSNISANGLVTRMVQVQLDQEKIDAINEKLLEVIDVQLADAKAQLDDAEAQIEAGIKAKAAGIEINEFYMPGMGGREYARQSALDTADVMNQVNPDFIRIRSMALAENLEMYEDYETGLLTRPNDVETIGEIRLFLENLHGITSWVDSDHILNILLELKGRLPQDKDRMLALIDRFLDLPEDQQMLFRLGRRLGLMGQLRDLSNQVLVDKVKQTMDQANIDKTNIDAVCDRLMIRAIPI